MWLIFLLLASRCECFYFLNLTDPVSMRNYSYIQRDYFERSGRWAGSTYNPSRWLDRHGSPEEIMRGEDHAAVKAKHAGRKLQASRTTVPCKDGKTYCSPKQVCMSCLCTIFPTSRYMGGHVFMGNNNCIWSDCRCGTTGR